MIMSNSTYNQLTANLELLKLTQMKLHLDEIRDFVTTNGLSFTEGLLKLSSYEVDFKEQNASRSMIKAAAFPFVKELKDYDFEFQPSINEQEMRELASLGFLEKNENIVFLGPSGVGKTHLATSIGIAAATLHHISCFCQFTKHLLCLFQLICFWCNTAKYFICCNLIISQPMTTGEKIKYFRNMRGISQETLGQLSGINSATIKKYEYGIRNPKPDQLLKIANALGISINIFMDFDIETVSDVLSLLFKLDNQIDMKFEADKDDEGNFKPATVKLSFKNNLINKKLCTYMKALEIRENMINAKDEYSEEEYADSLQHINENIEEIKQHLLDDNMVVKKGTDRLTAKNYPN